MYVGNLLYAQELLQLTVRRKSSTDTSLLDEVLSIFTTSTDTDLNSLTRKAQIADQAYKDAIYQTKVHTPNTHTLLHIYMHIQALR